MKKALFHLVLARAAARVAGPAEAERGPAWPMSQKVAVDPRRSRRRRPDVLTGATRRTGAHAGVVDLQPGRVPVDRQQAGDDRPARVGLGPAGVLHPGRPASSPDRSCWRAGARRRAAARSARLVAGGVLRVGRRTGERAGRSGRRVPRRGRRVGGVPAGGRSSGERTRPGQPRGQAGTHLCKAGSLTRPRRGGGRPCPRPRLPSRLPMPTEGVAHRAREDVERPSGRTFDGGRRVDAAKLADDRRSEYPGVVLAGARRGRSRPRAVVERAVVTPSAVSVPVRCSSARDPDRGPGDGVLQRRTAGLGGRDHYRRHYVVSAPPEAHRGLHVLSGWRVGTSRSRAARVAVPGAARREPDGGSVKDTPPYSLHGSESTETPLGSTAGGVARRCRRRRCCAAGRVA